MNDRELLELAAKAAGFEYRFNDSTGIGPHYIRCETGYQEWNPLTDDGDALRLAVQLKIKVCVWDTVTTVLTPNNDISTLSEPANGDLLAATRRAITRAAAEIGRSIEMTDLRQAAQQALEALEEATSYTSCPTWSPSMTKECETAATALRTALEQQAEPVGWLDGNDKLAEFMHRDLKAEHDKRGSATPRDFTVPVYTAQPQRKPLTDEEITNIVREVSKGSALRPMNAEPTSIRIVRAIEAAHNIKEGDMNEEDEEFERIEREKQYKLDSTKAAVVSNDYYWLPIDQDTPQGVKILLLGRSGVATMGHYEHRQGETTFWQFWAPLPRKPA